MDDVLEVLANPDLKAFFTIVQYRGEGQIEKDPRGRHMLARGQRPVKPNFFEYYDVNRTDLIVKRQGYYIVSLAIQRSRGVFNDAFLEMYRGGLVGDDAVSSGDFIVSAWAGESNPWHGNTTTAASRMSGIVTKIVEFKRDELIFFKSTLALDMINITIVEL